MNIAVDIRAAVSAQPTGKGQWIRGFVTELLSRSHSITLCTDRAVPEKWKELAKEVRTFAPGLRWHIEASSWLQNADNIDFYISPSSYIVPFLIGTQKKCLPVIHDMIAFQSEPHDRKAKFIERCTLGRAIDTAAHVFCVSQSTKEDIKKRYAKVSADKITAIYAGPHNNSPKKNVPDGKTILTPGTLCPRKNQFRIVRAYSNLPEDLRNQYKLVLVGGRGWKDSDIIALVENTPGVKWRNYVTDDEYEQLLASCTVLAFPSLYEGFGLQVLDAMQRGVPVLTSNRGSLREVVGDAACIVEPELDCKICKGLEQLLVNESLRNELSLKGQEQAKLFTWKRTVDTMISKIHSLPSS